MRTFVAGALQLGWKAVRALGLGGLVAWLHPKSALRTTGWLRSFKFATATDRFGNPIPWFTYPAVDFLQRLDVSALRVFEYGAGASTLYFARRARQVVAVEHTMLWHDRVAAKLGHPHVVVFRPRGDTYAHEIESHGRFDIVVIDGVDRAECAMVARENLTPQGVMIWDDADRADYRETSPRLLADGYRQIIFAGMAPITFLSKGTAVIYRSGRNCLGI